MPRRPYLRSHPDSRPTYDDPAVSRTVLVGVTLIIVLLTGLSLVVHGLM